MPHQIIEPSPSILFPIDSIASLIGYTLSNTDANLFFLKENQKH
jgi:hypothetical protein